MVEQGRCFLGRTGGLGRFWAAEWEKAEISFSVFTLSPVSCPYLLRRARSSSHAPKTREIGMQLELQSA